MLVNMYDNTTYGEDSGAVFAVHAMLYIAIHRPLRGRVMLSAYLAFGVGVEGLEFRLTNLVRSLS